MAETVYGDTGTGSSDILYTDLSEYYGAYPIYRQFLVSAAGTLLGASCTLQNTGGDYTPSANIKLYRAGQHSGVGTVPGGSALVNSSFSGTATPGVQEIEYSPPGAISVAVGDLIQISSQYSIATPHVYRGTPDAAPQTFKRAGDVLTALGVDWVCSYTVDEALTVTCNESCALTDSDASFTYEGAYASETAYTENDVVLYTEHYYRCIAASTGNLPTDTDYWVAFNMGTSLRTILTEAMPTSDGFERTLPSTNLAETLPIADWLSVACNLKNRWEGN